MDSAASIPAPTTPPAPSSKRTLWANIALGLFCLYVAAIYVLALDQNLHWNLFPTKVDKDLTAKVQQLGDASLSPDARNALNDELIQWNTFAVPPLLNAIEKGPPAVRDPAVKCLQTLALKYYNVDITKYGSDPVQLRQWWAGLQADWAKAEKTPKSS